MTRLIWAAMSGGVDSSVSAALLRERGWRVVGVTLSLGRGCIDEIAVEAASRMADRLGIPHRVIHADDTFQRCVTGPAALAYRSGMTPNPCVACNDLVKFGFLLDAARRARAALATGHYARIVETPAGLRIGRALDATKDQSYFLYRLGPDRLRDLVFPLGDLRKTDVRSLARELGLAGVHLDESQDACIRSLSVATRKREGTPGPICDQEGRTIGHHAGYEAFTVGQRKGLGLSTSQPWYVVRIEPERHAVIVGPREALAVSTIIARDVVWHGVRDAALSVQWRYRCQPRSASVSVEHGTLTARLDAPAMAVAPGQALVCYDGDIVVGGGTIQETI